MSRPEHIDDGPMDEESSEPYDARLHERVCEFENRDAVIAATHAAGHGNLGSVAAEAAARNLPFTGEELRQELTANLRAEREREALLILSDALARGLLHATNPVTGFPFTAGVHDPYSPAWHLDAENLQKARAMLGLCSTHEPIMLAGKGLGGRLRGRDLRTAILQAIRDSGHDPQRFPNNRSGKPGPKAEIRDRLGFTPQNQSRFKHAWDAMLKERDIVLED